MSKLKFNSRKIEKLFSSPDQSPVYIVAEIGINHNGSLKSAINLIEAAHDAGVDAVKFQKRNLNEIYVESVLSNSNNSEWSFDYLIPILKECELSEDSYNVIRKRCQELELDFIVTPFDKESTKFCSQLEPAALKISSADFTNYDLVLNAAGYRFPLIMSTGMWNEKEIEKCCSFYKKHEVEFSLLLTQSTYPAPYSSLNLNFIKRLKQFSEIVGYSGHERGVFIPVAAVAMGCRIIEKHITFDKESKGPDHKASMLPEEWVVMVNDIRSLEQALGQKKEITQAEILNKEAFAKSAVAIKELEKGHVLSHEDVVFKAPGKGIFQHEIDDYIGMPLKKDVKANRYISRHDFESELLLSQWKSFNFKQKWGLKCRFHDFNEYSAVKSSIIEFHCSHTDLDLPMNCSSNEFELIIHAPEIFSRELVDICSDDSSKVERSLAVLQKSIDRTIEWGKKFPRSLPKLVVHLGGMLLDQANLSSTRPMMDRALKNFKKLNYPRNCLTILPENLPPRPWYLGGEWFQHGFMTAEDMMMFCDELDLDITYDICHAQLYCAYSNTSLIEYTKKIARRIRHMHISDASGINGEGLQIGEGDINFKDLFDLTSNLEFSWVPEIWSGHLHHGEGFYKALIELEKYNFSL